MAPTTDGQDRTEQRHRERQGSAAVRAVGRCPTAELRHGRCYVDGKEQRFAVPYLAVDVALADSSQARGVADGHGARLRYAQAAAYAAHVPTDRLAHVVYDLADQLRCETLLGRELPGAQRNIDQACLAWSRGPDASDFTGTAIGTLLYTVMHMLRARLIRPPGDEQIETDIEETRARISPIIGMPMRTLVRSIDDPSLFFPAAAEFAEAVAALADGAADDRRDDEVPSVLKLFIPLGWDDADTDELGSLPVPQFATAPSGPEADLLTIGGYHRFTTDYDVETTGELLYPVDQRLALRRDLDRLEAAQAVSVGRLARRLQRLLAQWTVDGWDFATEDGVIDAARLGQLVADPANTRIFKSPRLQRSAPVCVSFLVDTSGSMKRQRYESLAVLVDTMCRALDLAGATSEVLGFTTASWNGGRAMRDWRAAGSPNRPGRLGETLHIVYKDADTSWRRSRTGLAAMLRTQHYREGIDGEALLWAYGRLLVRPEPRRILVMVSDGAPMDAATLQANGEVFLPAHLRAVAGAVERDPRVSLRGLSVDVDVAETFAADGFLDLDGALTMATYHELLALLV